jgi:hypothetical protein
MDELPLTEGWGKFDWEMILSRGDTDSDPVSRAEIVSVPHMYSSDAGNNRDYDDTDFAALVELTGGRWATLHAGNDTSGWGCFGDYVRWRVFSSRDEAIAMGLTNESRRWLGLELPKFVRGNETIDRLAADPLVTDEPSP